MKARVRQNRVVNPYRSVLKILKCVLFDRWHRQVTTPKVARPCCIRCHLDAARRWNQSYSAWTLARNRGRGGASPKQKSSAFGMQCRAPFGSLVAQPRNSRTRATPLVYCRGNRQRVPREGRQQSAKSPSAFRTFRIHGCSADDCA